MTLDPVPFHVGVVVENMGDTADQLTRLLGIRWASPFVIDTTVEFGGRRSAVTLRLQYSRSGPAHIELIDRVPHSVWARPGLHHIGLWSDDPERDSLTCDDLGVRRESVMLDSDGNWYGGLYHRNDDGLRLELSNVLRTGPFLEKYLSGDTDMPL